MRKRILFLLVLVALVVLGVVFLPDQLARLVRLRSTEVVERACGPYSTIRIDWVDIDLTEGRVVWKDIEIRRSVDSSDTSWTDQRDLLIQGHVDSIAVSGLSVWRLLTSKHLAIEHLRVHGPRLELLRADPHETPREGPAGRSPLTSLRLDTLTVADGQVRVHHIRPDRPELRTDLRMVLTGVDCKLPHDAVPFAIAFSGVQVQLDSLRAQLPPLYEAGIGQLLLAHPDSAVTLRHLTITPKVGPKEYHRHVRYETDLFRLELDSLRLQGMDLGRLVNGEALVARALDLFAPRLWIHRDKSMPDAPFAVKAMPARLLRELPLPVRIDPVQVHHMDVRYFERDQLSPDYGEVDFTGIDARITGLNTLDTAADATLHVHATAQVYGRAPVRLDLRTRLADPQDRFSLKAHIGALPFQAFNRMTDDLVLVRATAGKIHGIDLDMQAGDDRAQVEVGIEYEGLDLMIRKHDGTRRKDKLLSFVVNQVKRNKNLRSDANFRTASAEIERWKDRQIFNYMWRGLREGIMLSVMPKVIGDVKQATATSVDDKVREERRKARRSRSPK